MDKYEYKNWAKTTFERLGKIEKENSPEETGVKLLSGHIQSDIKENLETQERNYGDIVYNFRWLSEREIKTLFVEPSKYVVFSKIFRYPSYRVGGGQKVTGQGSRSHGTIEKFFSV